ncbi:MAG: hypothetical protein Q6L49_09795, partial [Thermostichales cyanobacterium HHBFW_bins_127]
MSQLLGVHVVTALVAAGVAFVPQRSVQEAVIAGLVAGTGTVVAEKVAARSQQQLFQQQQWGIKELQRFRDKLIQQLQQKEKEITELKGSLNCSQAEQTRLSQLLEQKEQQIAEIQGSLEREQAR